jgi:hypothetical protein
MERLTLNELRAILEKQSDHASALEILRLGLSLLGGTWPVAASVPNEAAVLQPAE